jgi:glutamate-1-semialdehyde aminotransferase
VPAAVMKHVVSLPWNDLDACVKILEKEAGDLAALIVDPMLANAG